MAYAVVRTDNLAGTTVGSLLRTAKAEVDIQNGSVIKVVELLPDEREKFKAEEAADAAMGEYALVASVEIDYENHYANLDAFTNKAGALMRAYVLTHGDTFGVTAEAIDGTPEVGAEIALPSSGYKWTVAGDGDTAIGTIIAEEQESGYDYFVIRIS